MWIQIAILFLLISTTILSSVVLYHVLMSPKCNTSTPYFEINYPDGVDGKQTYAVLPKDFVLPASVSSASPNVVAGFNEIPTTVNGTSATMRVCPSGNMYAETALKNGGRSYFCANPVSYRVICK